MTKDNKSWHNKPVSIHITNKLFSNRSILFMCAIAVVVGFLFVNLLIFYFPRDNRINLNGLSNISIQSIATSTKNQIVTTDLNVYNIVKAIAKDGILITYAGSATKLNKDYQTNSNSFTEIFLSKGFITTGQDNWMENKQNELNKIQVLDLSKSIQVNPKLSTIDISFGNKNEENKLSQNTYTLDYNYIMSESNLKISIESITSFLIKIDSNNKDIYYKNQIELTTKIADIENQYSTILQCSKLPIITNSTNLTYLSQKYGLDITQFENFDATNPDSNQIKYIKEFAKSKNITSFFVDKKIPLIDYTNLKNSLGLEIYYISDYIYPDITDTLAKNLENLKKSQGCA